MKRTAVLFLLALIVAAFPGKASSAEEGDVRELSPAQIQRKMTGGTPPVLVNTMSLIECRDHRIPGSECIPVTEMAGGWRGPEDRDREIVFYCESPSCRRSRLAAEAALKQGFRNAAVLAGGLPAWKESGYEVLSTKRIHRVGIPSVKPDVLARWIAGGRTPLLLDIRTPDEFKTGSIAGSVNVPFETLQTAWRDLPMDRSIVVVDDRGHRSFLAACYLFERGLVDISRLFGGLSNWKAHQSKGIEKHGSETARQ